MIGQTVSHYRILQFLGRGGMGEVFLAEDTSLRRKVALKFLPPEMQQDESAHKRFVSEARSAAALDHPNICTIHEVSAVDGKDFIVMEYVEGKTLRDRLAEGPLPLSEAMQIVTDIAEALEEAHGKGIIHRDLKPANVMLTRKGHAKVMDFGLAKRLIPSEGLDSRAETLTMMPGEISPVGTLAYMSPEQLRCETVDVRSDIFSLGVVFYEMLGKQNPFRAGSILATSDRILHDTPWPVGTLNREVPPAVEQLLDSMLAKDPAKRPGSAPELLTRLPSAYDYYLRARGYLQDYQKPESIESAIEVLQHALKLDPQYAHAYAGMGEARWRQYQQTKDTKWVEEALQSCKKAVALDANLASGHACLGVVFIGTGKYEEAMNEFQRAVLLEPTNDEVLRGLGSAYQKLGRLPEAEKTYQRAIELLPQYWAGYNRLGSFYYRQGRYREATEEFKQVIRLAPDSFTGYSNLGGTYLLDGRYAEAITMLQRSVALRPTGFAYSNLGTACFFQRRFAESAAAYEQAVKLGSQDWLVWGNLGDSYCFLSGKRTQADEAYRKALSLGELGLQVNAKDATLLGYMAYYHAMLNEKEKAQACEKQALAVAPRDPELLFNLALAHSRLGETGHTLDWLKKALAAGYSRATVRDTPLLDNLRATLERFASTIISAA